MTYALETRFKVNYVVEDIKESGDLIDFLLTWVLCKMKVVHGTSFECLLSKGSSGTHGNAHSRCKIL